MSGGMALLDYDGDGWLDIYLTNAPNVGMALAGKKARGGAVSEWTFTDASSWVSNSNLIISMVFNDKTLRLVILSDDPSAELRIRLPFDSLLIQLLPHSKGHGKTVALVIGPIPWDFVLSRKA